MDQVKEFFQKADRFAGLTGIDLMEVGVGRAKAKLVIKEHHLNGVGTVHGGMLFTLADFVFAAASNSYGTIAMAINANISFVKAVSEGTLYAEAVEESCNHKLGTYNVRITNQDNELIASFQGMAYRKKSPLNTSD